MTNSTDPLDYSWWLASRSAGIVAYLLLSLSVVMGLMMASRFAPLTARGMLRAGHERVALLALGATGAHALLLLGDGWLKAGPADILVPFASSYRPLWTGVGVLATYVALALSLSYYARRRLGARRWRNAHRLIPIAWAMAAVHTLGAGTDAWSVWLQIPLALTLGAVVTFVAYRVLARRAVAGVPAASPPAPVAEPARQTLWL